MLSILDSNYHANGSNRTHILTCWLQGINELSREIYDVALKEKYMGEKIPQVWLKFEESIVR